jgi:hypothetical protein
MKTKRARKQEVSSLHYEAPTQHAGRLLILIHATNGLVTPRILPCRGSRKARGMTLAEPNAQTLWEAVEI